MNFSFETTEKAVFDGSLAKAPKKTRVAIPDVGIWDTPKMVKIARAIFDMGLTPVAHLPARRFQSFDHFKTRIKCLAQEANVRDVLLVAGESQRTGYFQSSMALYKTGLLDEYGIKTVAFAAHPEGSPMINQKDLLPLLLEKQALAKNSDAEFLFITQFGFDMKATIDWGEKIRHAGVTLPIHLGLSGPAKMTTLIRYAALCGVGNSLTFLKNRMGVVTNLMAGYDPKNEVNAILPHIPNLFQQLHFFPFGGVKNLCDWWYQHQQSLKAA